MAVQDTCSTQYEIKALPFSDTESEIYMEQYSYNSYKTRVHIHFLN